MSGLQEKFYDKLKEVTKIPHFVTIIRNYIIKCFISVF